MDVLRRLEPERTGELALQLGVRAMVGAADDVRDLEVVVVDDAREVVGRRAVRAEQGRAAEADRAVGVRLPHAQRRLAMTPRALALAGRPLVPRQPKPLEILEDRLDRPVDLAGPVGVVDPQQQPFAAAPVGDRREGATEVQRPRRAGRETDSRGHPLSLRSRAASTRGRPRQEPLSQEILRLLSRCS